MTFCENCGKEILELTDTYTYEKGLHRLEIKNVPITKCNCQTTLNIRMGLIMDYFSKYDHTTETNIDFEELKEKYTKKTNIELIDPENKLNEY